VADVGWVIAIIVGVVGIVWGAEGFAEHLAPGAVALRVSTFALALLLAGAEPEELATGVAASLRHDGAELVDPLLQMIDGSPGLPMLVMSLAQIYCDLDRPDDARATIAPFVDDNFRSVGHDFNWLLTMCNAAGTVADLSWGEAAVVIVDRLRPFANQIPYLGPVCAPEVSYHLAQLTATLGLGDQAEMYFSQSAKTHERIGAEWALAATHLGWGRFLATSNNPADRRRASLLFELALDSAQRRGYGLVERRASEALESLANPPT
jgi:hypothetical protein